MQYKIAEDHYVPEFDIQLYVGGVVYDGDLEPDLTAQLVSNGVLVPEGQTVIRTDYLSPVDLPMDDLPVADNADAIETEEAPVEEAVDEEPVSRRRSSRSNS